MSTPHDPAPGTTRREFIKQTTAATAGLALVNRLSVSAAAPDSVAPTSAVPEHAAELTLSVNGTPHRLQIDSRVTLLDALRERVGLTGTKKGCDRGECGACTVHIDGRRVLACLTLAVMADGREITTIEGLAQNAQSSDTLRTPGGVEGLHPLQAAFIEHDAFQCGYCTSGQIMSGIACIREGHATSEANVAEFMSGNLCRCAAYPQIRAAILQTAAATGKV